MTNQSNKSKEPIVDFEPAPGYLLCTPVKREDLAALYDRAGASNLSLPDNVGKVSDSVGVGQVIKMGPLSIEWLQIVNRVARLSGKAEAVHMTSMYDNLAEGDYVAFMPFTDLIIEIDGQKYSLVGYDKIRAVRKGSR